MYVEHLRCTFRIPERQKTNSLPKIMHCVRRIFAQKLYFFLFLNNFAFLALMYAVGAAEMVYQ